MEAPAPTEVRIPCICPDKSHADGDSIGFLWPLDFSRMALINRTIRYEKTARAGLSMPAALAMLAELYLRNCITSWTLQEDGKPIPATEENVERYLMNGAPDVALDVADAADDLYSEAVLSPLVQKASTSSLAGATSESTSPPKANGAQSIQKRSSRSSKETIPTAGIVGTA